MTVWTKRRGSNGVTKDSTDARRSIARVMSSDVQVVRMEIRKDAEGVTEEMGVQFHKHIIPNNKPYIRPTWSLSPNEFKKVGSKYWATQPPGWLVSTAFSAAGFSILGGWFLSIIIAISFGNFNLILYVGAAAVLIALLFLGWGLLNMSYERAWDKKVKQDVANQKIGWDISLDNLDTITYTHNRSDPYQSMFWASGVMIHDIHHQRIISLHPSPERETYLLIVSPMKTR